MSKEKIQISLEFCEHFCYNVKFIMRDKIIIKGAREHNLKNIDLEIPRNQFVVITGVSGSGKSSLAIDTIYAEGQRRYVESLSSYARQFLELMGKPDVDKIEGLSPAICIEQRALSHNPRSIVATATEIYDYMRLLFARIGIPYCYRCGRKIEKQSISDMADSILSLPEGTRAIILSPVVRGRKGEYQNLLANISKEGFVRVRVDGKMYEIGDNISLDKNKKHTIEIVVDRLIIKPGIRRRLVDSIETSVRYSNGLMKLYLPEEKREMLFSQRLACPVCGISYEEIEPRLFSFNSPYGACPNCSGLGFINEFDPELIVPDGSISILKGAVRPWGEIIGKGIYSRVKTLARELGFDINTPFDSLPEEIKKVILHGTDRLFEFEYISSNGRFSGKYISNFEGVIPNLRRRYRQTSSPEIRSWIERFMTRYPCPECNGSRLRQEAMNVKINGVPIQDVTRMTIKRALSFFENLALTEKEHLIADPILKEITSRLSFLIDVGVDYLTLDRETSTLSGGEAQRIHLATQIGSQLVGVLYVLDEPSIGLHQRDNKRLLETLSSLRDIGNTVIVIEHDEETIRSADFVVDLGPKAGREGGYLVAAGTPEEISCVKESITGQYLSGRLKIKVPEKRRPGNGKFLVISGLTGNNLKDITVRIPLGCFTCVTGVSGSGKSTLINQTLYPALMRHLYRAAMKPLPYKVLSGLAYIDKVININQSPIGRTPRSNPATYTGVFTPIRQLFASLPESIARGYKQGRFSFNVEGGRCEVCRGAGYIRLEMHFLPDVYVPCDRCKGKRYNPDTLEIKYRGKSIADVLELTVDEAKDFFENIPAIRSKLELLQDVGLGYIQLGQSATTLSGGEAQRVKLSLELSKRETGQTVYLLDEPTVGLHSADVKMLLNVLSRLVDKGNTVVVIEHNLDVIKSADWIIDLGPEGGEKGGRVVATGTPEKVMQNPHSYTGIFLKKVLGNG